jgi:hypothetical protein
VDAKFENIVRLGISRGKIWEDRGREKAIEAKAGGLDD